MATFLSACATTGNNGPRGAASLGRALPTQTCEAILRQVPLPQITAAMDARKALLLDEGALLNANSRIRIGRNCIVAVRKAFAR